MDYNSILLIIGMLAFGAGLPGVVVNKEGKPTILINDRRIRTVFCLVGMSLAGWSIHAEYEQKKTVHTSIVEKASPVLASYSSLNIQKFDATSNG